MQHLARQITNAHDLDIVINITEHLPLAVSTFNILLQLNASHGFVNLLLHHRWCNASHLGLFDNLRLQLPGLGDVLHTVLQRGEPNHEVAVRRTLYRAFRQKDKQWAREVCSGCPNKVQENAGNRDHAFCQTCFPVWCASTGRYYSKLTMNRKTPIILLTVSQLRRKSMGSGLVSTHRLCQDSSFSTE